MCKWFFIIRPATLFATLSPVLAGLYLAQKESFVYWPIAIITLCSALSIQIISNLVNDYFDYKKGSDSKERLGPVRAISKGLVTPKEMKYAIAIAMGIAMISGFGLVVYGGIPIILIGVSALCFAWLYTATPLSLSYLGIADLFVFTYFGPVATAGTFYLQTGQLSTTSLLAGAGCGLISMAVLTVNNIRDYQQDKKNGKKTIIVRLGRRFGILYYAITILLPGVILLYIGSSSALSLLFFLPALVLFGLFTRSTGKAYNRVLALTGLLNLIYLLTLIFSL